MWRESWTAHEQRATGTLRVPVTFVGGRLSPQVTGALRFRLPLRGRWLVALGRHGALGPVLFGLVLGELPLLDDLSDHRLGL